MIGTSPRAGRWKIGLNKSVNSFWHGKSMAQVYHKKSRLRFFLMQLTFGD